MLSEEEKMLKPLIISAHIKFVHFSLAIHMTKVSQCEKTLPNGRAAEAMPNRLLRGGLVY